METILSIIAIVLSIASGGFSLFTFIWTACRDRNQATLEAFNRLQGEVFDKLNTYKPAEIREICNDRQSERYKAISGLLARIEHFCVGLNRGIYDKRTFYALAHGYFDGYQIRSRIEPIIESKNSSKNSKEQFYGDTLSVLNWMEKETEKTKKKLSGVK
jgi:hypothetical protein